MDPVERLWIRMEGCITRLEECALVCRVVHPVEGPTSIRKVVHTVGSL